jgi:catechol 2,3-dioxygenase-like lactoylglutathione lyase family enzyme
MDGESRPNAAQPKFDVGGVLLDRPFRVRRLGHFHFMSEHVDKALRFYVDLLGFAMSDALDVGQRLSPEARATLDDGHLYFLRFAGDHHALIISSAGIERARGRITLPKVTVGHMAWQVGSMVEVVEGEKWFRGAGLRIVKSGRDTPGSNWHTYAADPDGHPNEIFYGMEQIGWNGFSRPTALYRGTLKPIDLPQISELQEVDDGLAQGIDMASGFRHREQRPRDTVTDGVLMARPFRVTAVGPVRMMVRDMERSLAFFLGRFGFRITEEVMWSGHRCVFLRAGTEHHLLALYPEAIAADLGLSPQSLCFSLGLRLHSYSALKRALKFLTASDVEIRFLPPELFPGMDYTAFAVDPDGHLVQLYAYMEQLGWEGRPRPPHLRRKVDNTNWPETIDPVEDSFGGDPFMGPLA